MTNCMILASIKKRNSELLKKRGSKFAESGLTRRIHYLRAHIIYNPVNP